MKTKSTILRLRRILVPIDFSNNARRALRYAIPLAAKFNARVTLLHIIAPAVYATDAGMGIIIPDERTTAITARKQLVALGRKHIPEKLRGKMVARIGQPYHEIVQTAQQLKMDLIVLTTHGYTGLTHVLLGSTAERVVRHAPCPVLTVRIG